jgi:hypothetical protein
MLTTSIRVSIRSSIAPADVSGGFERGQAKVWDSQTVRRSYSSMVALSQDTLALLWQSVRSFFPVSTVIEDGTSLTEKQVTTGGVLFAPSLSPGPLLVLIVTSVMFVF